MGCVGTLIVVLATTTVAGRDCLMFIRPYILPNTKILIYRSVHRM